jgi:hypothetical protein
MVLSVASKACLSIITGLIRCFDSHMSGWSSLVMLILDQATLIMVYPVMMTLQYASGSAVLMVLSGYLCAMHRFDECLDKFATYCGSC